MGYEGGADILEMVETGPMSRPTTGADIVLVMGRKEWIEIDGDGDGDGCWPLTVALECHG